HEFVALAAQFNRDPELQRSGGEIRDVLQQTGDIDPRLRDAIYAIERTGTMHPAIVRGDWHGAHGWFVVRLMSRRPAIDRSLAESSDWIRQRIVLEHRVVQERVLVERLAREAGVVTLPADQAVTVGVAVGDGGSGASIAPSRTP